VPTRTFYKTVIQVEVLSEEPLEYDDLGDVNFAISQGDCSGSIREIKRITLNGKQAAKALLKQGSSRVFSGL
jgi:hypothetical protein